jgi:WD40 repeat protein
MAYSPVNGGFLISVGYEIFANVWCPESVVSDILIGKFKGHARPIVDTKFIGGSPFNMTIDESNEIRIWDIKSQTCRQFVKPSLYTRVQGILTLNNNIVWIFGKRFIQFDTFSID